MNESIWRQPMVSHKITNSDQHKLDKIFAGMCWMLVYNRTFQTRATHQRNQLVYVKWNGWFAHLSGNHLIQGFVEWIMYVEFGVKDLTVWLYHEAPQS